jgi:tRNA-specific 2-thiouridylase
MSGGVDSSVAALRLVRQGYEVVGVTLHLWDYPDNGEKGRCCAPEDQYDARRVADHLSFPHYTFDRRELFAENVVTPFVDAYLEGRTPSPCVACNRTVKLRELLALADRLGAERVATGHYARIERTDGRVELHSAVDPDKDQSYFLHVLEPHELGKVELPLGGSTKEQVRAEAVLADLPGANKGESQELCFVSSGRYAPFVEERAKGRVRPGPIVDASGRVVGQHDGVHRFTVGQRKGLGVAIGRPAFVTAIDAANATVTLGDGEEVASIGAVLGSDERFDADVVFPRRAFVKVRARQTPQPATLTRGQDGRLRVRFDVPVRAVSPGQVAVAYDGTRVLGGATIASALPNDAADATGFAEGPRA